MEREQLTLRSKDERQWGKEGRRQCVGEGSGGRRSASKGLCRDSQLGQHLGAALRWDLDLLNRSSPWVSARHGRRAKGARSRDRGRRNSRSWMRERGQQQEDLRSRAQAASFQHQTPPGLFSHFCKKKLSPFQSH